MKKIIYVLAYFVIFSCNTENHRIEGYYKKINTHKLSSPSLYLFRNDTLRITSSSGIESYYLWSKKKERYYNLDNTRKGRLGYSYGGVFYKIDSKYITYKLTEDKIKSNIQEDLYNESDTDDISDMAVFLLNEIGTDTLMKISENEFNQYANHYLNNEKVRIDYHGLRIDLPKAWNTEKVEIVKDRVFQVISKNVNQSNRKGIVFTFGNEDVFGNSIEKSIENFKSNLNKPGIVFQRIKDSEYKGIEAKVLPYIINNKAIKKVIGKVIFFKVSDISFAVDIKSYDLDEDDFKDIEDSFSFNSRHF